jgi:hypothetical protein
MARGENVQAYVGIGKESIWATPVSSSYYVPLLSQDLNHNFPTIKSEAALGKRYTTQEVDGAYDPNIGGWTAEIWQDEFVPVVAYTLGADTRSGTSSPYEHKLGLADDIPSITVRKGVDLEEQIYRGFKINTLTLNVPNRDSIPTYTVVGVGKPETTTTVSEPTFTTQNAYSGGDFRLYIAAAGTAEDSIIAQYKPMSLTLTLNNQIQTPVVPLGFDEIQEEPTLSELLISGSIAFEAFDSATGNTKDLRDDFKNKTTKAFKIEFDGTSPYHFMIYLPQIKITTAPVNAAGRTGPIGISFDFEARYNTTRSTMIDWYFHDANAPDYV